MPEETCRISSTKGAQMNFDEECCSIQITQGFTKPIPPLLDGNDNRSLTISAVVVKASMS